MQVQTESTSNFSPELPRPTAAGMPDSIVPEMGDFGEILSTSLSTKREVFEGFVPSSESVLDFSLDALLQRLTLANADDSAFAQADELLESSVEPGQTHRIENFVLRLGGRARRAKWLHRYYIRSRDNVERRRSIVLTIGRLRADDVAGIEELENVIRLALADDHIRIREAAVRAAEALGSVGWALLNNYQESVPWLKRYAEGVRSDLQRRMVSR